MSKVVLSVESHNLESLLAPIENKIAAVDERIKAELNSDTAIINTLSDYLISSGGKRLRPAILLLGAQALNTNPNEHNDEILSAVVEFIHTATLLHDDVVDDSDMRRGNETANNIWGNQAAVLVGDFLYSRAFQMMSSIGDIDVVRRLSAATNTIAEGEVLQLIHLNNPNIGRDEYFKIIYRKTGALFEAAGALSALISPNKNFEHSLASYGKELGIAFQLVDDALDYQGDSEALGKNIGDDLAEGKVTLPLIYTLEAATTNDEDRALIQKAIENGKTEDMGQIIQIVNDSGAIDRTRNEAREHASCAIEALTSLPDTNAKTSLIGIAEFCVARLY